MALNICSLQVLSAESMETSLPMLMQSRHHRSLAQQRGQAWSPACTGKDTTLVRESLTRRADVASIMRQFRAAPASFSGHPIGKPFEVEAAKRKTGWAAVPAVPKVLGLGGLIPFFALSPPLMQAGAELLKSAGFDSLGSFILTDLLPSAAMMQIGYGTAIVSFLGAVRHSTGSLGCCVQSTPGFKADTASCPGSAASASLYCSVYSQHSLRCCAGALGCRHAVPNRAHHQDNV
jgi:hypothetical protein